MPVPTHSLRRHAAAFAAQQARLAACLDGAQGHHLTRVLTRVGHDRLDDGPHFGARPHELAWNGAEVLAHLRDSALVTYEQIRRLRHDDHPLLPSLAEGPPLPTASSGRDQERLVRQVTAAHELLADEIADLAAFELQHRGELAGYGHVTVGEVVRLHAMHLRSHVDQLQQLVA